MKWDNEILIKFFKAMQIGMKKMNKSVVRNSLLE